MEYQRVTPVNWQDGIKRFTVVKHGEGYVIEGPCPRCDHDIVFDLGDCISFYLTPGDERILIRCNCVSDHTGGPTDGKGCGAFGGVVIER
jgi:hypothetical protein